LRTSTPELTLKRHKVQGSGRKGFAEGFKRNSSERPKERCDS